MIYFWLAIVALVFAFLGFLIHAFYFTRQDAVEEHERQLEELKTVLSVREKESAEDKNELRKTREQLHDLKIQLEARNQQMKALQAIMKQQDEQIQVLKETASAARLSVPQPLSKEPEVPPAPPAGETNDTKIPLWKDNLNNILGTLDKIEKEVKK